MKIKVSYFLLFALLVSCNDGLYEEQEKESFQKISKTSLKAENHLIPVLETLGFYSTDQGSARTNSSGYEIMTDSILKVLQHDSLSYAYTFRIGTNNSEPVFENLILKSVTGGYIGFILKYESANGLTDLSKFTGKIKRFDLEENLLTERNFENGVLISQQSSNARVGSGPSMLCLADVTLSLECADSPGPSETTGLPRDYMCQEWVWVVEYTYQPCPTGGSGGGGGDDGGTFIPNPDPGGGAGGGGDTGGGTGSGGGSSGGSTGGGTGTSNPGFEGGGEEVGVLPPDIVEQRIEEIKELVEEDPFVLVEIPCDQIPNWQALAQHEVSDDVKDKIDELDSNAGWFDDWAIQTLNGANGTIANMDYFSVKVTTLPNNPETGTPFTAEGFLDYFRRNINDFVDESTFTPYCKTPAICIQETELWNSNNPTGAIIYIDIPVDDGVVICSEYKPSYWYFTTLEAPVAGNHPVSGTRQFGFERNRNGSFNFFVRGVDRFDSNIMENAAYALGLGDPFGGSDDLWESFQQHLDNFVRSNGGMSVIEAPVIYRPDWEKIKDILEGDKPVSDLGCN